MAPHTARTRSRSLAQYLADPSSSARFGQRGWPSEPSDAGSSVEAHPSGIALLLRDADFAECIPAEERRMAAKLIVLPRLDLLIGEWTATPPTGGRGPVTGAVVMSGLLARDALLGGRTATQLLGPGDVFGPWKANDGLLPCGVRWWVHEPVTLSVLDGRFAVAARRWPALALELQDRLLARADQLSSIAAILQLSRVEDRVLALLWHLADRFGRVTTTGVVVPLRLTHEFLGQLVGARRSTVTLAIRDLESANLLDRSDDQGWILDSDSRTALGAERPEHAGAGERA
jgi:hypothetical protein